MAIAEQCMGVEGEGLQFLWLELTSRCNLQCTHCYSESGPHPETEDLLTVADYRGLIESASSLGCRRVQFIGGEPTIRPELPELIEYARAQDFEFVEVYTNATHVSDELLACFVRNRVAVATSFYADDPAVHDAITKKRGSQVATVRTVKRMVDAGLTIRASIIVMDQNHDRVEQTKKFLQSLGVENIGSDRVRGFGRGESLTPDTCRSDLSELCGNCWRGSAVVTPQGTVAPCIMARNWGIGSVREQSLASLVESTVLRGIRERIFEEVWVPMDVAVDVQCPPHHCNPYISCSPYGGCRPSTP